MRRVGVVPAAGYAGRLGPSLEGSKEMEVIAERRVIDYLLERLARAAVAETRVVTRPEKKDLRDHLGSAGVSVFLGRPPSVVASVALGIAGLSDDDLVLLGFPDTVWEPAEGFEVLARAVEEGAADVALGLFDFDEPSRSHVVKTDEAGRVVSLAVQPDVRGSGRVWGCLAARARFLTSAEGHSSLGSLLVDLVGRKKVLGFYLSDVFVDIGTPAVLSAYREVDYEGLCARARERVAGDGPEGF